MKTKNRTLWQADNLEVLSRLPAGMFRLIYLDPPFHSQRSYRLRGTSVHAFEDVWRWDGVAKREWRMFADEASEDRALSALLRGLEGMLGDAGLRAYLAFMGRRLIRCRRLLTTDGSIVVHCDPTASHYLKLLLDAVFGRDRFLNEIVWHYTGGGRSKTYFSWKHDTLLWYAAGDEHRFDVDAVRMPYKATSSYAKSGIVSRSGKRYLPHPDGTPIDDVWDIPIVNPLASERVGYPTQKPLQLLERFVTALTDAGDFVLDPFAGSGTTLVACERLKRKWVGIDEQPRAIDLIVRRMKSEKFPEPKILHG